MITNIKPQWHRDLTVKMHSQPTPKYEFRDPEPNNIVLNAGKEEMLKVTRDGFYVRGVKVEQDEQEAAAVYNCFREWLTWAQLNRQ